MKQKLYIVLAAVIFFSLPSVNTMLEYSLAGVLSKNDTMGLLMMISIVLLYISVRLLVTGMRPFKALHPFVDHMHLFPNNDEWQFLLDWTKRVDFLRIKVSVIAVKVVFFIIVADSLITAIVISMSEMGQSFKPHRSPMDLLSMMILDLVCFRIIICGLRKWVALRSDVDELKRKAAEQLE